MDTMSNFLNQLKPAGRAHKEYILIPFSKVKLAVAKLLEKEAYVGAVEKAEVKGHPYIKISLLYKGRESRIHDIERVSHSSQRVYAQVKELRSHKYGVGMTVITTPKGVMGEKEARKEMVGGEVLFRIW